MRRDDPAARHFAIIAPRSGEVVDRCHPGTSGKCGCGKDLGPMEDHEVPSAEDIERFSGVTRECPSCHKEIADDVDACYLCGEPVAYAHKSLPTWAMVTGGLVVAGFLVMLLLGGRLF